MDSILDLLWLRVPPIRYVSPPACDNISSGSGSSGPIIVIEHPNCPGVTGVHIIGSRLFWDALPSVCEGSCSPAICYNIYRASPAPVVPASEFAVLAASTVTNTGPTVIDGDLGLSPGTSVTGFPPGIVSGTQHVTDSEAAQAQIDLTAAYLDLEGRPGGIPVAGNLGGQTLTPGIYKSTSSLAVSSGDLTLDAQGNADAVFIFQIASTLNLTPGRQIILAGGAQASNIFWQVGSSATLDTTSVFKGSILALTSITVNTGASVEGRLLAQTGAVTLDSNDISLPVSSGDSDVYGVIAECVHGTEFDLGTLTGCFRVSAITTEGECDLSEPACI